MTDPYAILGVPPDATATELKRAYRQRAREWHPDRNASPEAESRFKAIAAAWEILGDPDRRRRHDQLQGRVARGELPEAFLADVGDAMDRAEHWIRTVVLPHYAQYWRGAGAEMGARLVADVESLDPTVSLPAAGWWRRRQVRRLSDRIVVTALLGYDGEATAILQAGSLIEIAVLPLPLYRAGFREPLDIDRAVLRLLLARFARVMGGRARGLEEARRIDDAVIDERRWRYARWGLVSLVLGVMVLSALNGW